MCASQLASALSRVRLAYAVLQPTQTLAPKRRTLQSIYLLRSRSRSRVRNRSLIGKHLRWRSLLSQLAAAFVQRWLGATLHTKVAKRGHRRMGLRALLEVRLLQMRSCQPASEAGSTTSSTPFSTFRRPPRPRNSHMYHHRRVYLRHYVDFHAFLRQRARLWVLRGMALLLGHRHCPERPRESRRRRETGQHPREALRQTAAAQRHRRSFTCDKTPLATDVCPALLMQC